MQLPTYRLSDDDSHLDTMLRVKNKPIIRDDEVKKFKTALNSAFRNERRAVFQKDHPVKFWFVRFSPPLAICFAFFIAVGTVLILAQGSPFSLGSKMFVGAVVLGIIGMAWTARWAEEYRPAPEPWWHKLPHDFQKDVKEVIPPNVLALMCDLSACALAGHNHPGIDFMIEYQERGETRFLIVMDTEDPFGSHYYLACWEKETESEGKSAESQVAPAS